jgi:hypothetical protein
LNESRRLAEELQKVMTLRNRLTDAPDNVVQPQRLVVMEGELSINGEIPVAEDIILSDSLAQCSSSSEIECSANWIGGDQYYCVLFNDSLLLSREIEDDNLLFICLIPILDIELIEPNEEERKACIPVLQMVAASKPWAVKTERMYLLQQPEQQQQQQQQQQIVDASEQLIEHACRS